MKRSLQKSVIRSFLVFVSLGFVLTAGKNGRAQEVLALEDAIKITLQKNYGLLIARENMQIASNNSSPGNAGFLPTLDLSAAYNKGRMNSKQIYADGSSRERNNAGSENQSAGATLSWTIFDGFKMFSTYSRLKGLETIERYNLKREMESKIADVILTYYDVVRKKLILKVDREAVAISEERLRIVQQSYEFGASSNLDVMQAKVDLNTDRSAYLSQEVDLAEINSALNKILGRETLTEFSVVDTIDLGAPLSPETLREELFSQNTDILISREEVRVAGRELGEARSEKYPRLNLLTTYNYSRSESQAGFFRTNVTDGYTYGAQLSLNLFNGFNTLRKEQNSRLTERARQFALEELKLNLTNDFNAAVLKYQNSLIRLQLEQENVGVASQNVTIALELYRLGTITPLQLREVQRNYIAAKSRLISTAYEVKQNAVGLLKLTGNLVKE